MKSTAASFFAFTILLGYPASADANLRWIKVQHAGIEAEIPEFLTSGSMRTLMVNGKDTGTAYEPENYPITVRIYGVPPHRPAKFLDALFDKKRATYRVDKPGLGVLSGYRGTEVFYAICRSGSARLGCIDIVYPAAKKAIYDPIAARIAKSFRK